MTDWIGNLAALVVLTVLIAIFFAVNRCERATNQRVWVIAWAALYVHFFLQLLKPASSDQASFLPLVSIVLLQLATVTFLVAVSEKANQQRFPIIYWTLLAVPSATFAASALAGIHRPWILVPTVAVATYAPMIQQWHSQSRLRAHGVASSVALAVMGPWMIFSVLERNLSSPLEMGMATCFALAALELWRRYHRWTPGVVTAMMGFLGWSLSLVVALYFGADLSRLANPKDLWNVPVFMVVVGMIVIALEGQSQGQRALEAKLRSVNLELQELSFCDALTGVGNRRYFYLHIDRDIAQCLRGYHDPKRNLGPRDVVFFIVDIDHFKRVNDSYGHAAGDELLIEIGNRLHSVIRQNDMLIRWGGEEFLIVSSPSSRSDATGLAERILRIVGSKPFQYDNSYLPITCSVGWAPFPWFETSPKQVSYEEVLQLADRAMYEAKHKGRNRAIGFLSLEEGPENGQLVLASLLIDAQKIRRCTAEGPSGSVGAPVDRPEAHSTTDGLVTDGIARTWGFGATEK